MVGNETGVVMTASDVAEFIHLSTDQVYRLVRSGDLPHTRVGGSIRFFREEIVAYLKANRGGKRARRDA